MMSPETKTLQVEAESAHLFVQQGGTGDPILFVQGTGVIGEGWRPQLDAFAKTHAVATLDNRGIGQSTASGEISVEAMGRDCVAVLDALGWDRAHLVGHSLGGLIVQEVALQAPDRIRSLVLSCTFASGTQATRLTLATLWNGLRTSIGTRAMRRRAFLQMIATPEQQTPEVAERLTRYGGRDLADRPDVLMAQVRAMSRYDRSAELGMIEAPTLVQSARGDQIALPVYGRGLAERIPGARFVELDGAHAHTLIEPGPFNELLAGFLAES